MRRRAWGGDRKCSFGRVGQKDNNAVAVIFGFFQRVKVFWAGYALSIGVFVNAEGFKAGRGVLVNDEGRRLGDLGVAGLGGVSFGGHFVCPFVWYVMIIAYTIKMSSNWLDLPPLFYGGFDTFIRRYPVEE